MAKGTDLQKVLICQIIVTCFVGRDDLGAPLMTPHPRTYYGNAGMPPAGSGNAYKRRSKMFNYHLFQTEFTVSFAQ